MFWNRFAILVLLAGTGLRAQTAVPVVAPPPPGAIAAHPDAPRANPDDVRSPQAIVAALSASISGGAGVPRDWNRFRSLFVPGAGRMAVTRVPKEGAPDLTLLSVEEYAARPSTASFFELPIALQVETFGQMTHVYESYQLKHTMADAEPFARGVNSWELFFDGTRYYVLQVYWDTERSGHPLPAKLLP